MNSLDRVNPIFDKVVPIQLVKNDETTSVSLVFRIIKGHKKSTTGPQDSLYRLEVVSFYLFKL